jgi:hypothetical protein
MNVGDIYSFYSRRLACYQACQITGFSEEFDKRTGKPLPAKPAVLLLDWTDKHPPSPADFPALQPFVKSFYSFDDELTHRYVMEAHKPEHFTYCGNRAPVLPGGALHSYGFWPGDSDIFRQILWDRMPDDLRAAYKNTKQRTWRLDETEIPDLFPDYRGFSDLAKYPRLSELTWRAWSEELRAYLKSNSVINKLMLDEQQAVDVLDFRGTGLLEITIDITGVREIYLNDMISVLRLRGGVAPDLTVHDPHEGDFITLVIPGGAVIPKGLVHLGGLWLYGVADTDLARTVENHRGIRRLEMFGKPGNVTNFSAVSGLMELTYFRTNDVFGFTGADFPDPGALPKLGSLSMVSLPQEAAQTIKKKYQPLAKQGKLELYVRKARKDGWLAANMDNPFRNWDGDDLVPPGYAKKAAEIYRKTRIEMEKACAAADAEQECAKLCEAYIETFNKMDSKYEFIDTELRENIILALDKILTETKEQSGATIDTDKLMEISEQLRDF